VIRVEITDFRSDARRDCAESQTNSGTLTTGKRDT
jgi:hypothetical protein